MRKIKVCSLFSGIGGFEIGLFSAFGRENVEVVFASEIDKFASLSYKIIHGQIPNGDITKINEKEIPSHDLLVAGFPCQDFSLAGRKLGLEGTRGTLFFEIARIAKEKKPSVMLLENVKHLVNHDKGRTIEIIIKTLSDLGYTIDFTILNSKYFSVAQNRERVYLIAVYGGETEKWNMKDKNKSASRAKQRINKLEGIKTFNFSFPGEKKTEVRLKDIMLDKVDENLYLSKEKEEKLIHKIKMKMKNKDTQGADEDEIGLQFVGGVSDKPNWLDNGKELSRNYKQGSRIYDANGLSSTLSAQGVGGLGGHTGLYLTKDWEIRRLSPLECFRLQSFPDEYCFLLEENGIKNAQLYKMAGNAVTSNVISSIVKKMEYLFR